MPQRTLLILSLALAAFFMSSPVHAYRKVPSGQSLLVMNRSQTDAGKFEERLKKRGLIVVNEIHCNKEGWSVFEVIPASGRVQSALERVRNSGDVDLEGVEIKGASKLSQCTPAIDDPEFANQLSILQLNYGEMTCLLDAKGISQVQQPRFTIVDSGVKPIASEMADIQQYKFTGGSNGVAESPFDSGSHGTGVAIVACAAANNGTLLAGVASHANQPVKIVSCRTTDDGTTIDTLDVLRALTWCVDNQALRGGPGVINLSIQSDIVPTYNGSSVVQGIAKSLYKQGDLLVNGGGNTPFEDPSKSRKWLRRVGGIDENGDYWAQATYGPFDSVAPCVNVRTYYTVTSTAATASGTSFSCPMWAGGVALLMSLNPKLTAGKADQLLYKSGAETSQGYIKPDYQAAVMKALKLKP